MLGCLATGSPTVAVFHRTSGVTAFSEGTHCGNGRGEEWDLHEALKWRLLSGDQLAWTPRIKYHHHK